MNSTLEVRPSATSEGAPTKRVRVLCVDDDPQLQTSLELRFRSYNVDFDAAYYGMQGIAEALKSRPDVIILDVSMPNGTGLYLLECLKRKPETAAIPVILLTGMRDRAIEAEAFALGAEAYLSKPADFSDLVKEIQQFADLQMVD